MSNIGRIVLFLFLLYPGLAYVQPNKCEPSIGVNIEGLSYYSAGTPYNDLAKMSKGWQRPRDSPRKDLPLNLDQNGYLKSFDEDHAFTIVHNDDWGRSPDDNKYVLLYDGLGKLEFRLKAAPKINSAVPGRIEVELSRGRFGLAQLSTNEDDYLRNIRIIPKSIEARYQEQIVNKQFIELWKDYQVMRYLNLQNTNHSNEVAWEDRKKAGSFGAKGGSPIEDIIKIANETKTHPWLLAPHRADDDYFRNMAIYVKDNLNPDLKIYIEYTNETWNSGFAQTKYLIRLSKKNKSKPYEEYAKRAVKLFTIWEDIFGGTNRLVRVISTQFVNPGLSEKILSTPGIENHVDALAVGYYFGGKLGKLKMIDKTMQMSDQEIFDYLEAIAIPKTRILLREQKAIANKHNLDLIAYEAGQHLVVGRGKHPKYGRLGGNQKLIEKFIRINRNQKMKDLYLKFYENWVNEGGGLIVWFATTDEPDRSGTWGLLENMGQPIDKAPKYQAVKEMLKEKACN